MLITNQDTRLSVVIPVYNSGRVIQQLVEDLYRLYGDLMLQVVLVNDGSQDDSGLYCEEISRQFNGVLYIELRKNYGQHNAIMCGLNHVNGDYVVIMDDDYQHPPEELFKLLQEADQYDVVYSSYAKKQHHFIRNFVSWVNDWFATWLIEKPERLYLSSFKLLRREVVDEVVKYKGPFPYIDGLIVRVTASITQVQVEHHKRQQGRSNYTFRKLVHLWLSVFVNFSMKPMRVMVFAGVVSAIGSFLFGIFVVVNKIMYPDLEVGWASLMVVITMLFSIQFMFMGMIGEYLGKQYLDQNGTPQWVIRKKSDG